MLTPNSSNSALSVETQKTAAAVGIIGVGDPFMSASMLTFGESLWNPEVKARAKK
jgi:hypothetical protein